jgi:hypothetical protein
MSVVLILIILAVPTICATTPKSIFGHGKCITIWQGRSCMYERQRNEWWPGYLYFAPRKSDQPYQKWILERNDTNLYNLRNKKSNLTVEDHFWGGDHFLKTTNYRSRTMQFKFESQGRLQYRIITRYGVRTTTNGDRYARLTGNTFYGEQTFKILSCSP